MKGKKITKRQRVSARDTWDALAAVPYHPSAPRLLRGEREPPPPAPLPTGLTWRVALAQPMRERIACKALKDAGWLAFAPTARTLRRVRGRDIAMERAVLTGYVYAAPELADARACHAEPGNGLRGWLRAVTGYPVTVPEAAVLRLDEHWRAGCFDASPEGTRRWDAWKRRHLGEADRGWLVPGATVRIRTGAMAGKAGVVLVCHGREAHLAVEMFGGTVSMAVPFDALTRIV